MTAKKPTPDQTRKLDKLAKALKDVPPERLRTILRKDAVLQIRLSATEKASIEQASKRRGLSVTSYILRLHEQADRRQ